MLIAKIDNGNITVGDYRSLFPNTSFSSNGPTAEWMAENGCMGVTVWKPHTSTQKLVSVAPYIENNQVFTVAVEDKTQEEIAAATASKAAQVRKQRDQLLAQSDWMVIRAAETGVAMSADWAAYRQALRDISAQAGFPDVALPNDPNYVPMVR
jgi:hypothetical protein